MSATPPGELPGQPATETAPSAAPLGSEPTAGTGTPAGTPARRDPNAGKVPRTRTAAVHKSLLAGLLVLVLLLVFIVENTQSVKITYFGASGHLPLGVAVLIAAIGGGLLVGIVGTARILQLRRQVKRRR